MKISWKTIGTLAIGMAFILGIQQIPFQNILYAQAQAVRMLAGPNTNPFTSTYLTPTSNNPNPNMPEYALPFVNAVITHSGYSIPLGPVQMDINADGLLDFVYSYAPESTTGTLSQYIILNTGSGYNLLYICRKETVYTNGAYVSTYKGDCAAQ